jgi:hypothetical protein
MDESEAIELLRQGVKLLRTVYATKADFVHEALLWVRAAEHLLSSLTKGDDVPPPTEGDDTDARLSH